MRIAVLSDTHPPKGARRLPEACVELPAERAMRFEHVVLDPR